ncbi:hypothetical protein WA556_000872 [Blastocystis sp. ATCC 50177/Nand II]
MYYDSDAIYRGQSIYGGTNIYQEQGSYVPPTLESTPVAPAPAYQPPSYPTQETGASVGYRPPLFPGSSELAEVAPEPVEELPKRESGNKVLKNSLKNMANSLRKIQERAMRSSKMKEESEADRSIKALFSERIVKGRPDLFVASTPIPATPTAEPSPKNVLSENITGFFSQFSKARSNAPEETGPWAERQRDFNKRFGRNDAQYLRDALVHFCSETKTMYAALLPTDYQRTPDMSPVEEQAAQAAQTTPANPSAPNAEAMQRAGQQRIEDRIHAFTDALMTEIRKHKAWKNATEEVLRDTRDCVEKLIMEDLRDYTLGAVREEMKKEDTELEAKMADLQFLTMENLDVSEICRQNPDVMKKVMEELQQIQHVFSPAEKLECVIQSNRTLGALLQSGNKSGNDAGADDFLPAFIYTVLKSQIPKLPSTVEYVSRFRHPDELLSEGGYCLTNLSGAVSFLQNCGGCDFDIDADEFERQFHKQTSAPVVVEEEEEDLLQF